MNCTHETSIVISDCTGFSLLRCTWGCNQDLIQLDLGDHNVSTYTAAELAQLRARVKELERIEAAARNLFAHYQPDEDGCIHSCPENNPANGAPVYYVDDDPMHDLMVFRLDAALHGVKDGDK